MERVKKIILDQMDRLGEEILDGVRSFPLTGIPTKKFWPPVSRKGKNGETGKAKKEKD